MSLDPVLLARSWPERRPVVLASAALGLVAVAGGFSDRMRAPHAREQRLLESGLALTAAAAYERLPAEVGAAALRTPRAIGSPSSSRECRPTSRDGPAAGSRRPRSSRAAR